MNLALKKDQRFWIWILHTKSNDKGVSKLETTHHITMFIQNYGLYTATLQKTKLGGTLFINEVKISKLTLVF